MAKPPKKPARPRVPVPLTDIEEHLERQLRLLQKSCAEYDGGDTDEAGRIATIIRILAHDHGQSRSLLGQLSMKGIPFIASAPEISGRNLLSDAPLTKVRMTSAGADYHPLLDDGPPYPPRPISFDNWWNEAVIRLSDDSRLTRGELVLMMTNQDGGAHVDPEIDALYHRVAKANGLGFGWISGERSGDVIGGAAATVRQIAFELEKSIRPEWSKRMGNRPCTCGSGRKSRYCHGKNPPTQP